MPYIGNIVQDFSVNTAMLNTDSVTSIKIDDGTIVNADINASAAIDGSKISPIFSSHIEIQNASPKITFTDTDNNPDHRIQNSNGTLNFHDVTNDVTRLAINTDGHVDIAGNLDVGAGIDVTGNIVATGAVDAVGITIGGNTPTLNFNDANDNPDFRFLVNSNSFILEDTTNSANRLVVNSDGHIDIAGNLDVGAGIDVTGAITATGSLSSTDITVTSGSPFISFVDSDHNSDFNIQINAGSLNFNDTTNSATRMSIASDGTVDVNGNLDCNSGLDVTGATTLTRSTDNQTTTIITNNGTTGGHCLKLTSGGTGAGTNIFSCFRDNQSSESEVLNVNGSGVLTVTPGTAGTVALFASSGTTNGGVLDLRNTQGSNQTFRLAVGGGDNAYVQGRGFFIRDETNSATRLAIDTSGNTSLGTGTPASNTKLLIRDDSATTTVMLKLRNYKSSVNTKPTLRFEAVSSTGQGASSDIQGLAGTDAGAANDNGNDSAMKFIVRHGGSGTEREAFTVKNDGNIHFPNGQGIDFGVTSGGNSSSELFDDYEEGTFTPVINYDDNASAGQTYNEQQGKYIKVGKFVHFVLRIDINNPGTGDGWVSISGLPYNMEDMLSGITYEPTVNAEIHDAATAVGNVRAMFIPSGSLYLMLTTAQVSWFNNANRFGKSTYITGGTDIRIRGYYMSTT